ncbi:chloramphenicol acetyltransferase [bacterium]|nr:chloramphenicol acetyltransferase [bacterium]
MKIIDKSTWNRHRHFDFFTKMDYPHFNLTAPIEVTSFYNLIKLHKHSLTIAVAYLLTKVANEIPEFCQRIRGDQVIEHDVVHPSYTVLAKHNLFSFCTVPYHPSYNSFVKTAHLKMDEVRQNPTLEDGPMHDDLLFMTAIPWVAFTSIQHPMHNNPVDSVPRFAWGKITTDNEKMTMPLSVQAHHALLDGLHAGLFFKSVQENINSFQITQE